MHDSGRRQADRFFVISDDLCKACVHYCSGLAPHPPVSIGFHPRLARILARHLSKPQQVPTQPLIGSRWQSPVWGHTHSEQRDIRATVRNDITEAICAKRLGWILPAIADAVEDELVRSTGCEVPKARKRCRGIDSKWKPINEKAKHQHQNSAVTRWLSQLLRDLASCRGMSAEDMSTWSDGSRHGYEEARSTATLQAVTAAIDAVWQLRPKVIALPSSQQKQYRHQRHRLQDRRRSPMLDIQWNIIKV